MSDVDTNMFVSDDAFGMPVSKNTNLLDRNQRSNLTHQAFFGWWKWSILVYLEYKFSSLAIHFFASYQKWPLCISIASHSHFSFFESFLTEHARWIFPFLCIKIKIDWCILFFISVRKRRRNIHGKSSISRSLPRRRPQQVLMTDPDIPSKQSRKYPAKKSTIDTH